MREMDDEGNEHFLHLSNTLCLPEHIMNHRQNACSLYQHAFDLHMVRRSDRLSAHRDIDSLTNNGVVVMSIMHDGRLKFWNTT